uniref:Uncharacterized protein n=1 Tax=Rangifer tarandus platyrhynchus TaxID=3082113 RepID=A0ACB0E869_RANTA|nr:unnamed protein product [Rangifer tarandus platyrhynchus]
MQPTTPLVLCVLLSQVGERGLLGAPRAPFLHSDCLARAGRGGFRGVGGLRAHELARLSWRRLQGVVVSPAQRRSGKRSSGPDCGLPGWRGRPGIADFPGRPGPFARQGGAQEGASGPPNAAARLPLSLKGAGRARIGVHPLPDLGPTRALAHPFARAQAPAKPPPSRSRFV